MTFPIFAYLLVRLGGGLTFPPRPSRQESDQCSQAHESKSILKASASWRTTLLRKDRPAGDTLGSTHIDVGDIVGACHTGRLHVVSYSQKPKRPRAAPSPGGQSSRTLGRCHHHRCSERRSFL